MERLNPAKRPSVRKKIALKLKGNKNGIGNLGKGKISIFKYGNFVSKDRKKEYLREWKQKKRQQLIKFMGGKCVSCGFDDIRALHIDHITGGGNIERRSYRGNYMKFNKELLNGTLDKKRYQLLCANCNFIKKITNNEDENIKM